MGIAALLTLPGLQILLLQAMIQRRNLYISLSYKKSVPDTPQQYKDLIQTWKAKLSPAYWKERNCLW